MTRKRSRSRDLAEYVLARGVLGLARLMPAAAVGPLSSGCGWILQQVIRSRRDVVRGNVELAYGQREERPDADRLCHASFSSLCQSFFELARMPRSEEKVRARIEWGPRGTYDLVRALSRSQGVVMAACHFGSYEVSGILAPLFGIGSTTLVRPLDNPHLERWLSAVRQRFGQRLVSNRGGLPVLLRDLRAGRNVAVLVDLNHSSPGHVFVDYFGQPAATAPTAALLAVRTGRPLVTVFARRSARPLRWSVEFGHPVFPRPGAERQQEVLRLLQAATTQVEQHVRREPGQWLWTHRRWKTRPRMQMA